MKGQVLDALSPRRRAAIAAAAVISRFRRGRIQGVGRDHARGPHHIENSRRKTTQQQTLINSHGEVEQAVDQPTIAAAPTRMPATNSADNRRNRRASAEASALPPPATEGHVRKPGRIYAGRAVRRGAATLRTAPPRRPVAGRDHHVSTRLGHVRIHACSETSLAPDVTILPRYHAIYTNLATSCTTLMQPTRITTQAALPARSRPDHAAPETARTMPRWIRPESESPLIW